MGFLGRVRQGAAGCGRVSQGVLWAFSGVVKPSDSSDPP